MTQAAVSTAALPTTTTATTTTSVTSPTAAPAINRTTVDPPADVILDTSLGQTGMIVITTDPVTSQNDYALDETAGKVVGNNLYYSFLQFSLATGETVNFNLTQNIQNILARVTGGSPSMIDGTININSPVATNFFLMNPAGVVFTANASINVPGSFTVTTADYLKFADGTQFNAVPNATADAALSGAAVSAFGFLPGKPSPPGQVNFIDAGTINSFSTLEGMNFVVVAGNQTIDGASLTAPSGEFILVSVAGPGEVPAVPSVLTATPLTALPAMGTINIQNGGFVSAGSIDTSAPGYVEIDAGTLNVLNFSTIDDSSSTSSGPAVGAPSGILIRSQTVLLSVSGTIQAANVGLGPGGTIDIQAQSLTATGASQIDTSASGAGAGGSITIAANDLSILGSAISTSTVGPSAAGTIMVTANDLSIAGSSAANASGILAESGNAGQGGEVFTGRSGDIDISAQQLTLTSGGEISTTTFGPGQGGNISVTSSDISISGSSTFNGNGSIVVFQSGILAASQLPGTQGAGGQGGNVAISTSSLDVSANGLIAASTVGSGGSGNVTINAGSGSIVLDGTGATLPTGIAATTSYQTGGKGGDIAVAAGSLTVLGGAEVSAATSGGGIGGNVSVTGGSVVVSGTGSTITAQTTAPQGGAGGNLQFNVNSVSVLDGGQISASTQGSGQGGSITINANQVTVEGNSSSIVAETSGMNTTVSDTPNIADVTVNLTIQSTVDSRLDSNLADPGGDSITLFNSGDALGANLTDTTFSDSGATPITGGSAAYTGTFQPANPLAIFNSGTANGTWDLQIGNGGLGRNNATLVSATLIVNGQPFAATNLPEVILSHGSVDILFDVTLPVILTPVKAGSGGSIQINSGTVNLSNGGTITASTHGDGAAGSVTVQASSININGSHASSDTGLFASANAGSTGRGGSISVSTKELQITGSGNPGIDVGIVALSQTSAPAGNITIQTSDLTLDAAGEISSANLANGPAGSVNVTAGNSITLQSGSLITVVAQGATAGTISLTAGQNVELFDGSTITASAALGGGNITIKTGQEFYLNDSSVVANAGTGAGGNITIDPEFIILDHGLITANAAAGAGGNILIAGQYFFDNESPITATGSTAGSVEISTLPLDVVNALAGLQGGFIDLSTDLQESCTMRLGVDASSFLVIGRGGVEDSPGDPEEELSARLRKKGKGKVAPETTGQNPQNSGGHNH